MSRISRLLIGMHGDREHMLWVVDYTGRLLSVRKHFNSAKLSQDPH